MNTASTHYRQQHLYIQYHLFFTLWPLCTIYGECVCSHVIWWCWCCKSGYIPRVVLCVFLCGHAQFGSGIDFPYKAIRRYHIRPSSVPIKNNLLYMNPFTLTTFSFITPSSLSFFHSFLILHTDSMDITAPQFRNRFIHTRYQALRKCCGCIHLRVGAGISCLIWMVGRHIHTYTIGMFISSIPGIIHVLCYLVISKQKSQVLYPSWKMLSR